MMHLWALGPGPLDWLLVPRVACDGLESRAGEVNVSRLAIPFWANINHFSIDGLPGGSLDLDALATWAPSLLKVTFVHGSIVCLILLWKALWIKSTCISTSSVHLTSSGIRSSNATPVTGHNRDEQSVENTEDICE